LIKLISRRQRAVKCRLRSFALKRKLVKSIKGSFFVVTLTKATATTTTTAATFNRTSSEKKERRIRVCVQKYFKQNKSKHDRETQSTG